MKPVFFSHFLQRLIKGGVFTVKGRMEEGRERGHNGKLSFQPVRTFLSRGMERWKLLLIGKSDFTHCPGSTTHMYNSFLTKHNHFFFFLPDQGNTQLHNQMCAQTCMHVCIYKHYVCLHLGSFSEISKFMFDFLIKCQHKIPGNTLSVDFISNVGKRDPYESLRSSLYIESFTQP